MPRPVAEWIGKTETAHIPERVRLRVLDRWFGHCAHCGRRIVHGLRIDHRIALINGGEHRESNLQPLHVDCHALKTGVDLAEKVRVYRKRRKHLLGKRYRSITTWRKFDGTIVRKPRER
jgi:5-methylcytosine-specific restriction endonuclease McrA